MLENTSSSVMLEVMLCWRLNSQSEPQLPMVSFPVAVMGRLSGAHGFQSTREISNVVGFIVDPSNGVSVSLIGVIIGDEP